MDSNTIAKNYAKALFEVAKEKSCLEPVLLQLDAFSRAINGLDGLSNIKAQDLDSIASKVNLDEAVINTLKLMAERSRLILLPDLHSAYQLFLDEEMGVARGDVLSAKILSSEQRKEVETYVSDLLNKKVILNYKEDPTVLGGFVVNVGSTKIEGSLKYQLTNLKNLLNNGAH